MTTFMNQANEPIAAITAAGRDAVTLYFGLHLDNVQFMQSGQDLLVIDEQDRQFILKGYFTNHDLPVLRDAYGIELSGSMVSQMAGAITQAAKAPAAPPFAPKDAGNIPIPTVSASTPAIPTLRAAFGSATCITPGDLQLPSTADVNQSYFTVMQQGQAGLLTVDNLVVQEGDTFAFHDLANGKLTYYHDESNNSDDMLKFSVLDMSSNQEFDVNLHVMVHSRQEEAI